MAKKKTILQVTFVSGGKTLEKRLADAFGGGLEIGRDAACAWRPTTADLTMREHHARLIAKGDLDVRIEPVDGAPLVRNARPFSGGRLAAGDRVAVGDSEIQVREVPKVVRSRERYHRLEGMNGETKDRLFPMVREPMTIGSAPDCDLVVKSDIVADRQAELTTDEHGAVWIRDLGSRNGTFVNGERLTDKARMVKHADVIGVSIWDFRFLDRTVAHTRTNTGRQLLLAALTLFVCIGGYYVWRMNKLDVRAIVREATALAATGDIDAGYRRFQDAYKAYDVADNREILAYARARMSRWHTAWEDWETFKDIVSTGRSRNFSGVLDVMGRIRPDVAEDWSWQPEKTSERMAEASEGEALMSLYFTVSKFRQGHVMTEAEIASINARFDKFGVEEEGWIEKDPREWIRPLRKALVEGAKEIKTHMAEIERVNAEVRKCGTSAAELEAEMRRLRDLELQSTGSLRMFATTMLDPMSLLVEAAQTAASNTVLISACEPERIVRELPLPTPDDCLINGRLGEIREHYVRRQAEMKLTASRLSRVLRLLERARVTEEEFKAVEPLLHIDLWRRLVTCDTFGVPPPSRKRTGPVSEYDRYLGIEWLWGFIKQFPLAYPDDVRYEDVNGPAFEPVVVRGLRRGSALRQADALLSSKAFDPYRTGKVAGIARVIRDRLARAETCMKFLDQIIDEEKDSRAALVACAVRLMLLDRKEVRPEDVKRLKEMTAVRRKRMEAVEYDEDAPADSPKAKAALLAKLAEGVPGDVRLLPYWKALYPEAADKTGKDGTKK